MATSKSMQTFLGAMGQVCSSDRKTAEAAIETCFQLVQRGELTNKDQLILSGAVDIMLKATAIQDYSGNYYHRALGVLIHMMRTDDEYGHLIEKNVAVVSASGGVRAIIRVMETHPRDNFLLLTCLFGLEAIGQGLVSEKYKTQVGSSILEAVVVMLENNRQAEKPLFLISCGIMIEYWQKQAANSKDISIHRRAVRCIMIGLFQFSDCPETIALGRCTLSHFVEPEKTTQLMSLLKNFELHTTY